MLTRKQYRTIQKIKTTIPTILIAGVLTTELVLLHNHVKARQNQQLEQVQQEAETYKQCVINQSEVRGFIIRSECSPKWKQLDQIAELEYTQRGYDIYLQKGGE